MTYRAFDGGMSIQAVPDDYVPTGDDKIFHHLPTREDLTKAFTGYGGVIAIKEGREKARLAFEAAAFAGCRIESKSAPSLNGTYSLKESDFVHVIGIAVGLALTGELPGGGDTFNYEDQDGSPHAFNREHFTNLFAALRNYYHEIRSGEQPRQPLEIP
jgi:hypothetical protein